MTATTRAIVAVLALALAAPAVAQVRDPRSSVPGANPNAAPTGTGAIGGAVLADDSSRPLRLATVVLVGALTGVLKVTSTDRDGRFSFAELPADAYTIAASKAPYLGAVAGAKRPARPGSAVVLAAGQRVADLTIRLPMAAAITGVITDELGQPTSAVVAAQRRQTRNGETTFVPVVGLFSADELGRYRIYGLPPGDYVISAYRPATPIYSPRLLTEADVDAALRQATDATGLLLPPLVPPAGSAGRAVPFYYPNSANTAEATPITVSAGDERSGIDIRIERAQFSRVGGTVAMQDGQLPQQAIARLWMSAGSGPFDSTSAGIVGPDGRFNIPNVAPGNYLLVVTSQQPTGSSGMQSISVTGDSTVNVVLRPPLSLSGKIAFDGASPPALAGLTVPFAPMSSLAAPNGAGPGTRPTANPSDATGAFTVTGIIPGRYVFGGAMYFGPNATSTTWALQSVLADGRDITDLPLEITPEARPKELVVTLTDKFQSVSGKLQTSQGQPASDYTVVVFPADKNYWTFGSRRVLTSRPASDGTFTIGGSGIASLPPGQYILAAVTDIGKDEQYDPALLNQLLNAGTLITIAPGERKVQDLVIR